MAMHRGELTAGAWALGRNGAGGRWIAGVVCALGILFTSASVAEACIGVKRTITVGSFKSSLGTGKSGGIGLRRKEVVLTFDDGPVGGATTRILSTLRAHCTKATFFPTGRNARANGRILRRIAAAGHTVAHHTHGHPNLRRLSLSRASSEIDRGVRSVNRALGGRRSSKLFRYPYLARSRALDGVLRRKGLLPFGIGVDSGDWRGGSARTIVNRIMGQLRRRGSGVILMHDIHSRTAAALPLLLTTLKREGYRVVHVRSRGSGTVPRGSSLRVASLSKKKSKRSRRALKRSRKAKRRVAGKRTLRRTTKRALKSTARRKSGLALWLENRRKARAQRRKALAKKNSRRIKRTLRATSRRSLRASAKGSRTATKRSLRRASRSLAAHRLDPMVDRNGDGAAAAAGGTLFSLFARRPAAEEDRETASAGTASKPARSVAPRRPAVAHYAMDENQSR